ncbi:phage FluMu protein Com [Flavobacterium sp. 28A]|nr:phage FluMu protein Com [Flavobacterium sp. 28A]
MPKIICEKCNEIINLSEIPSKNQWMIISDIHLDECWENDNINSDKLYSKMEIMVKCPNCQTLHVFWNGFEKKPQIYLPCSEKD